MKTTLIFFLHFISKFGQCHYCWMVNIWQNICIYHKFVMILLIDDRWSISNEHINPLNLHPKQKYLNKIGNIVKWLEICCCHLQYRKKTVMSIKKRKKFFKMSIAFKMENICVHLSTLFDINGIGWWQLTNHITHRAT